MKKLFIVASVGLGGAIAGAVGGCMTGQQLTIDAISGSTQPYVEAFIEYRGPQERWAGPANWVMHVVSRDTSKPEIVVPPAWPNQNDNSTTTSDTRKPASQMITSEEARAKITEFAAVVNEPDPGFEGCLYPVHVRLVRADGNVLDKQGCRGQTHWAKAASDTVDFFIGAGK